jgi:hypothetical protein
MTKETDLSWVKSAVDATSKLPPPEVETVRPEVRTGTTIPNLNADREVNRFTTGRLIVDWGYSITKGQESNFMARLATLDAKLRSTIAGPGLIYRGTYAVVISADKGCGDFRTVWELERYGNIEDLIESSGPRELVDFRQLIQDLRDPHCGWTQTVLREFIGPPGNP